MSRKTEINALNYLLEILQERDLTTKEQIVLRNVQDIQEDIDKVKRNREFLEKDIIKMRRDAGV